MLTTKGMYVYVTHNCKLFLPLCHMAYILFKENFPNLDIWREVSTYVPCFPRYLVSERIKNCLRWLTALCCGKHGITCDWWFELFPGQFCSNCGIGSCLSPTCIQKANATHICKEITISVPSPEHDRKDVKNELPTRLEGMARPNFRFRHHWINGNLPLNSECEGKHTRIGDEKKPIILKLVIHSCFIPSLRGGLRWRNRNSGHEMLLVSTHRPQQMSAAVERSLRLGRVQKVSKFFFPWIYKWDMISMSKIILDDLIAGL